MYPIRYQQDSKSPTDSWQKVKLTNFSHLVNANKHNVGILVLSGKIKSWLSYYVTPYDCTITMSITAANEDELIFQFRDPDIAMLFKLTWQS